MITSQQSSISLSELLFDNFTELHTNKEGIPVQVFNTLTNDYSKEEIRKIIEDTDLRSLSCQTNERAVAPSSSRDERSKKSSCSDGHSV